MWSFPTDKVEPIEKARIAGFFICAGSELILRRPIWEGREAALLLAVGFLPQSADALARVLGIYHITGGLLIYTNGIVPNTTSVSASTTQRIFSKITTISLLSISSLIPSSQ